MLASACNLRLDSRELSDQLVDLSQEQGNDSYTRDLYGTSNKIEDHHAVNSFVAAWTAWFNGKQKQACETAEALWCFSGSQFPGVLQRDASDDTTSTTPPNAQHDCR